MKTYINIDERYGEQTEVTVTDYQKLNADCKFGETWRFSGFDEVGLIVEVESGKAVAVEDGFQNRNWEL